VLGPDSDSQPFVEVNGETEVLVSTITPRGVSPSPFGSSELTGFGIPEAMDWNESGPNSVSDGSSTVAFEWAGPPESSETGGDVSSDTVAVTQEPGGETENFPASVDGLTATFSQLTDGDSYTYSDTVSNECGTSGDSGVTPTFTPGVTPSMSATPPAAVVGAPYSYTLAVTPTEPGTFDATVTADNGVGIQFFTSGQVSESLTMTVEQIPSKTSSPSGHPGRLIVGSTSPWS
jgi:hypothetical protein